MKQGVYTVSKDGTVLAQRKRLIWVKQTEPGLYLVCGAGAGEGILLGGTIYHVRGCPILPGKETVMLDYIESGP